MKHKPITHQPNLTNMDELYGDEWIVPIVGCDPSLVNLGMAFGTVDVRERKVYIEVVKTYYINKLVVAPYFGMDVRMKEMECVRNIIKQWMIAYNPEHLITEKPVFNKRIGNIDAYAKQMEGISSIKFGYHDAIVEIPGLKCADNNITIAHPGDMKELLGVPRSSGDKDLMTKGVQKLINENKLELAPGIALELLDDHSVDAISMIYTKANHVIANMQ